MATGKRLYTLGESTDWVYAVAWSPDGKHLAAAGVDRSIRVWEASAAGGKVVQSVFAHEAPVIRLAYSADGKTLYSLGEDRTVKAWDDGEDGRAHRLPASSPTRRWPWPCAATASNSPSAATTAPWSCSTRRPARCKLSQAAAASRPKRRPRA